MYVTLKMQGRAHTKCYLGTRNEKEMKNQTSRQLCLCFILFEIVLGTEVQLN